nr:MAG: polyprotein [Jingmen bat iflavirus 1]
MNKSIRNKTTAGPSSSSFSQRPMLAPCNIEDALCDIIVGDYMRDLAKCEEKYQAKYDLRHRCGLDTPLDDLRLSEEMDLEYKKIIKNRNYLWYLVKSKQYELVEKILGTNFLEDYLSSLKVEYVRREEQSRLAKVKRSKSDPILFSKCRFLYDNDNDDSVATEKEEEFILEDVKSYIRNVRRSRKERYSLVTLGSGKDAIYTVYDNSRKHCNKWFDCSDTDDPPKRKIPDDANSRTLADWDKLAYAALRLRACIEKFEELREKLYVKMYSFLRSRSVKRMQEMQECIEMEVFYDCNSDTSSNDTLEDYILENEKDMLPPRFENSPESVAGNEQKADTVTAHNVVLTETEVDQVEVTAPRTRNWGSMVSSDVKDNHDVLVNRWFRIGTYEWNTQQSRDTTIISLDLPKQAILVGNTCDQPNKLPFRIHRLWRGTMEIKIQINANKFQVGQLQASWFYQPKADASFLELRRDVYARSGGYHVVINASPSNEVTMRIPFKAYKSMLQTKLRYGYPEPLDEGTLFITVLSPLVAVGNTSPKANFTVFIKFTDNEFTGMIAGDIDTPPSYEMMQALPGLVKVAESLLTSSRNDNNRDNPPDNRAPVMFVPTASHSWSIGNNLSEPVHNLRLSGTAQTKHPDVETDEMTVNFVKRKFQLLDIFVWRTQDSTGTLLWSIPANPIPPRDRIHVSIPADSSKQLLAGYQLTPVGFVSSIFEYWRGSLEYRFDFVATNFHEGRVMLAYIPGIDELATPTLEQARASPHVVLSLQDTLSYTWRVPYISDTPWWPRRYAGDSLLNNHNSPSKIFIFVANELVLGETVPPSLEVLVYMRGGEDFEVAVPVQPSIGLASDRRYLGTLTPLTVFPTNDQYYSGAWHQVPGAQAFRRATTSEAYEVFTTALTDRLVYYFLPSNQGLSAFNQLTNSQYVIRFCIFLSSPSGYGGFVGLPLIHTPGSASSDNKLEQIVRTAFANNYTVGSWINDFVARSPSSPSDTTAPFGFFSNSWTTTGNPYGGNRTEPWEAREITENVVDIEFPSFEGNRDQSFTVVDNTQTLESTQDGMVLYGEKFNDLKDYCRRYQFYARYEVLGSTISTDIGKCSLTIPVVPQGLRLDLGTTSGIHQIWNRARNGHIPVIASLYRFYRGSIRLRILITNSSGLQAWYQHRPDRRLTVNAVTPCETLRTAEAVLNHGYAYYIQNLDVNNIIEIEVPFYQKANFGLLQDPNMTVDDFTNYFSLGEIALGFFGSIPSTQNMEVSIFYSLADDHRFSTFQGVPPMVLLDDLPLNDSLARFEMLGWFTSPVKTATDAVVEAVEAKASETVQSLMAEISAKTEEVQSKVGGKFDRHVVMNAISHFVHCVINPTFKTIAWAICCVLLSCGLIVMEAVSGITSAFYKIFDILRSKYGISDEQRVESEASPRFEGPTGVDTSMTVERAAATGLITCLLGCMCAIFGVQDVRGRMRTPKSWPTAIFEGIERGMKLSNVAFIFLRNIMSVLDSMRIWICSKFIKGYNAIQALDKTRDVISQWIERVTYITDPRIALDIKYNQKMLVEFYDLYTLGKRLISYIVECDAPNLRVSIHKAYDRLDKIAQKLADEGVDPHVRKQPYTIYMYGGSNIGKSEIQSQICQELLKSQNIKTPTVMNCVISTTSKYWDDCDRQPVLVVDDMFAVQTEELLSLQLQNLFAVVSPVVLIPPKAHLEDKGKPYAPIIFWINSNYEYFRHPLVNQEAVWRRRNILINAERDESYPNPECYHCKHKLKVHEIPAEHIKDVKDNHHLKFRYKLECDKPDVPYSKWLTYEELMNVLKKQFADDRAREEERFRMRLAANRAVADSTEVAFDGDIVAEWTKAIELRRNAELASQQQYSTIMIRQMGELGKKIKDMFNWFPSETKPTPIAGCYICNSLNTRCGSCMYLTENPIILKDPEPSKLDASNEFDAVLLNVHAKIKEEEAQRRKEQQKKEEEELEDLELSETSSISVVTSAIVEDVSRFENDVDSVDIEDYVCKFFANNSFRTSEKVIEQLKRQLYTLPFGNIEACCALLRENLHLINLKLNEYPNYVQSYSMFKRVLEEFCTTSRIMSGGCCHNPKMCKVFHQDGRLVLMDSSGCVSIIGDIFNNFVNWKIKCSTCLLTLPWIQLSLRQICLFNYPKVVESWMDDLIHTPLLTDKWYKEMWSDFNSYTYEFITKRIPAAAKKVWNFITSMKGMLCLLGGLFIGGMYMLMNASPPEPFVYNSSYHASFERRNLGDCYYSDFESKYDNESARIGKHRLRNDTVKPMLRFENSQPAEVLPRLLDANSVQIYVEYEEDGKLKYNSSTCFMLYERRMLIERHYWEHWIRCPSSAKFWLRCAKTVCNDYPLGLQLNLGNFKPLWFSDVNQDGYASSNLGIVVLPPSVPCFKDLRKFIATTEDHPYINTRNCYLYDAKEKNKITLPVSLRNNYIVCDETGKIKLDLAYAYPYSKYGLCGSILVCGSLQRPIIGIHYAGTGMTGFSEPLYFETFSEKLQKCKDNYDFDSYFYEMDDLEVSKFDFKTILYPQATVPKELSHFQGSKTQYRRSLLQDVFPVTTEPNPLSPNDRRLPKGSHPLRDGVAHMGKPPCDFSNENLNLAKEDLQNVLLGVVQPVRAVVGVVSLQDAIVGNSKIDGFEPLEWSTSPGFPLVSFRPPGTKGKKWLFDLEECQDGYILKGLHPQLKKTLNVEYNMRKRGIRVPTVFTDCLKDTVIPVEKCKIPGKTRVFSISPVQFTIAFKMYFNDFLVSYRKSRFNAEHSIGIDVNSMEWTELVHKLQSKGNKIVAGDYKNYGPGLMLSAVKYAFDIIIKWYEFFDKSDTREVNQIIRRVLLSEILYSYHLIADEIYSPSSGIPSGSPITTELNSLVNSLYLRCAWLELMQLPFSDMHLHLSIVTYGDDVCVNVSDEVVEKFNTNTLNIFFNKYNIVFTDVDKSDNIIAYRTLDNVTFLKRGFKRHPYFKNIYLAPIEEDSIFKCINWIREKGDPLEATLENCTQACELAFGRGPEYCEQLRNQLIVECNQQLNALLIIESWDAVSKRCYNV